MGYDVPMAICQIFLSAAHTVLKLEAKHIGTLVLTDFSQSPILICLNHKMNMPREFLKLPTGITP